DTPDKMSPLTKNRANIHNSDVQTSATETFQRPPGGREVYAVEEQAMKHTEQVKQDANFENREIRGDRANASANAPHNCQSGWVFVTDKNGNQCVKRCPHCKAKWEQPTTPIGANTSAVLPDFNFGQNFPDFFGDFFDSKPRQQEARLPEFKKQPPTLAGEVSFTESAVTGRLFNQCWQAFEQSSNIRRSSLDERTKKRMNGMMRNAARSAGSVSAFQTALDEAIKSGGKDQPPLQLLGSLWDFSAIVSSPAPTGW